MKTRLNNKFHVYPSGNILLIGAFFENSYQIAWFSVGILPQDISNITVIIALESQKLLVALYQWKTIGNGI